MNTVVNNFETLKCVEYEEGNLFRSPTSGTIYILVLVAGAWATISLCDGDYYKVAGRKEEAIRNLAYLGDAIITVSPKA